MTEVNSTPRAPNGTLPSDDLVKLSSAALAALTTDDPSERDLLNLHAIFGSSLQPALELVDRGDVVRIQLPTGRHIHQVASSTGAPYTLHLPSVISPETLPYCPCAAFAFSAIVSGKTIVCKHLLALGIALQTGRMIETQVREDALCSLLGISR